MKPLPHPSKIKIPPLPPILIGNDYLDNYEYKSVTINEQYVNEKSLSESEMLLEVPEDIIELYNKLFKENVKVSFCINCGNLKAVPWLNCDKCKYSPRYIGDLAMHFATTAFNPNIKNESNEYRISLFNMFIESNKKFTRILAAGMLKKMKPVLNVLK